MQIEDLYDLGRRCAQGDGDAQSYELAVVYFKQAAEALSKILHSAYK